MTRKRSYLLRINAILYHYAHLILFPILDLAFNFTPIKKGFHSNPMQLQKPQISNRPHYAILGIWIGSKAVSDKRHHTVPFLGVSAGEHDGEDKVGEFSFSSLKLKLFLQSESAPKKHTKALVSLYKKMGRKFILY